MQQQKLPMYKIKNKIHKVPIKLKYDRIPQFTPEHVMDELYDNLRIVIN